MAVSVFLPARKGSERIINKNTRQFAHFQGGLLELKLEQLLGVDEIQEIILSTNDETSVEIGKSFLKRSSKLRIEERPDNLASSETPLHDLIKYVPQITLSNDILWTHVTSPFCDKVMYEDMIKTYEVQRQKGFDSLISVQLYKNFLWDPEKCGIINKATGDLWPRTQDLKNLFEINNATFLAPRSLYMESGNRIGRRPFLYIMSKITSLDIDDEEDFKIAEAVYERING